MDSQTETSTKAPPIPRRIRKLAEETVKDVLQNEGELLSPEFEIQDEHDGLIDPRKPEACSEKMWAEITKRLGDKGSWDIFTDYADLLVQDGIAVYFEVIHNGSSRGRLEYPLTWNDLHKRFGQGSYRVNIKLVGSGRFREHQCKALGEFVPNAPQASSSAAAAQPGAITVSDLMALVKSMDEAAEKRTQALLERISKPKDDSSQNMFLEFVKMQQAQADRYAAQQAENTKLLIEAMRAPQTQPNPFAEFTKMIEVAKLISPGRSKDSLDPLELQNIVMQAEQRGEERERRVRDSIDDMRSELTDEKQPKSAIDKILEKAIEAFPVGVKAPAQLAGSPNRPGIPRASAGIPRQNPVPRAPVQAQPEGEPMTAPLTVKDRVFNALGPNLQGWITGGKTHAEAAAEAEQIFLTQGLTREAVLASVSLDDVRQKMGELKIPKFAADWVESFYATYQNKGDGSGPAS